MKNYCCSGRPAEVHNEKLELPGGPRRYTKRILNVREALGGSIKKKYSPAALVIFFTTIQDRERERKRDKERERARKKDRKGQRQTKNDRER